VAFDADEGGGEPHQAQHDDETGQRFAAAGRVLFIAKQVAHPESEIEPLGFAEQHVLAIELVDGPAERDEAVENRGDEDGQEIDLGGVVLQLQERFKQQRHSRDRHEAIERAELDPRHERQEHHSYYHYQRYF